MKKKTKKKPSSALLKPVRLPSKKKREVEREEGPRGWFLPVAEETYARLAPRGAPAPPPPTALPESGESFTSAHLPGAGESALATVGKSVWLDRLREYRRRKSTAALTPLAGVPLPAAPAIPGGRNWLPLGPSVVLEGQTVGSQPVAGRVSGVAVAPGAQIVYVASAAGGVFRSDDGGTSWRSLMDGFDLDPTNFASASLACGAIAIDPADPDRVYVGTGEGDTHRMFDSRVVNALPAYRGIGPICTDDGGNTWLTEPTGAGSPTLAGEAFFALAVDPEDRENVLAATTEGLYQRVPRTGGSHEWVRRRSEVHSSVVVASSGGTTRFFAAEWGEGVFHSSDGATWNGTGSGFPTTNVGRVALGVQPNRINRVYAYVAATDGSLLGVYRLDSIGGSWKKLSNVPPVLPGEQGDYNLTIAVDPMDENVIYLGGDYADVNPFPGSVWRCTVESSSSGFRVSQSRSIGTHAHADVHVLVHSPGDPDELWCGGDGGLFLNRDPKDTGEFTSQNDGLSCLCSNFIGQHPTDPSILFTGLQDNGTARSSHGAVWNHVNYGDGGYCLVNWHDPDQVLVFANGTVYRSTSGGKTHDDWSARWEFPWATMTQPIVGTPFDADSPADAKFVAVGAGRQVFVSRDFAASWPTTIALPSQSDRIFALAFASTARLFIGTTSGKVFVANRTGNNWSLTRLDDASAGPLGLVGLITDVAIDWADDNLDSVYVTFGGMGDPRRVWRFDGTAWEDRSGTGGANSLLDVEHNALVVDPTAPQNLYVGADIGVWHSPDAGANWAPLQNGLPDAPVFDLQLHATQRLLRAATYGRGVYELALEP
jgi:photosystem II stability/assembly factor-like uncharacterized protein